MDQNNFIDAGDRLPSFHFSGCGCGCGVNAMAKSADAKGGSSLDPISAGKPGGGGGNPAPAIQVNTSATARLEAAGEVDSYSISVVKGAFYTINLNGTGADPVSDTFLQLFDSGGRRALLSDDDGGVGVNSLLTFQAKATGTHIVKVSSFTAEGQAPTPGQYTLSFTQMAADASSAAANASVLSVNSSVVGFAETSADADWYKVNLQAGEYYEFQVAGGADYNAGYNAQTGRLTLGANELDTVLEIYDSNGTLLLRKNDDISFPDDVSSALAFSPTHDGQYFIKVGAYAGDVGGYNLQVKQVDLDGLNPLDTIDWGTQVTTTPVNGVNTVSVYFARAGEVFDGVTSLGWNAYEMQQAMVAFQQYENIINVDFTVTDIAANATFKLVTTQNGDGTLGYFNPPGETNAGVGVFWRDGYGWEEGGEGGLGQGGYGFITLIHEIGHGMGLAHPHDDGGTSDVMPGVFGPFGFYGAFDLNQGVYSTMSYNDGWQLHPDAVEGFPPGDPTAYGYQGTMMAMDIALLQQKYGANASFASGADTYTLATENKAGTFFSTIWDTGGVDTIAYTGAGAATIDLRAATLDYSFTGAGALSWVDGIHGGFTIANGVVIENARGGSGSDVLIGNSASNALWGGAGADTFVFSQVGGQDRLEDFDSQFDTIDVRGLGLTWAEIQGASRAEGGGTRVEIILDNGSELDIWINGQVNSSDWLL